MCRGSYIATNITGCIAIIVIGVIRGRSLITANRASFPVGIRVVCIRGTVGMRGGSCCTANIAACITVVGVGMRGSSRCTANITACIAAVGVSVRYRSCISAGITARVAIVTVRVFRYRSFSAANGTYLPVII